MKARKLMKENVPSFTKEMIRNMIEEEIQIIEQPSMVRTKRDVDNDLIIEDYKNRVIMLRDVDENILTEISNHIIKWNKEDSDTFNGTVQYVSSFVKDSESIDYEKIAMQSFRPITLKISSYGGDVTAGLGLMDIIMSSKTPIIGINMDIAASMSAILFTVCHVRYAMPDAVTLYHDGSLAIGTSLNKFLDYSKHAEMIEDRIKDVILNYTDISDELYDKNKRVEWYINTKEAKENLGIVDGIIGEDIEIDELF